MLVLRSSPAVVTMALAAGGAVAYLFAKHAAGKASKRAVAITGGCGNLGVKLATHLLELGWRVVLIEHPLYYNASRVPPGDVSVVLTDLAAGSDRITSALRGCEVVVHFSAVNPYPNASWLESAGSMSHTFNLFLAAEACGVRRVILASSNHVMGGYKDLPAEGAVFPTSPPCCGTILHDKVNLAKSGDAVAYAAAKLAGEQLARALAARPGSATSFIALRIGWCQPGANLPATLDPSGSPPQFQNKVGGGAEPTAAPDPKAAVDAAWFKNMWLSNADFLRYFTAALDAHVPPGDLLVLNAMSNNAGMRWSIAETQALLNVKAQDNVWGHA